MRPRRAILGAVLLLLLVSCLASAQIFVGPTAQGSGNCSSFANRCTVATGIAAQPANSAGVIHFDVGTYAGIDLLKSGASPSQRLVLQCDAGISSAITAIGKCQVNSGNPSSSTIIQIDANNVDILGFDIGNCPNCQAGLTAPCTLTPPDPVLACPNGNSVHYIGNYVHDLGANVSNGAGTALGCPENGMVQYASVHLHTTTDMQASRNFLVNYGSGNTRNPNCHTAMGLESGDPAGPGDIRFYDNIIINTPTSGITVANCDAIASNNTIVSSTNGFIVADHDQAVCPTSGNNPGLNTLANNYSANVVNTFFHTGATDCTSGIPSLYSGNQSDGLGADFNPAPTSCDVITPSNPLAHQAGTSYFVNYQTSGSTGDYHLLSGSIGVAKGSNSCVAGGFSPCTPTTDFASTPMSSPPPVGAYTFGAAPPPGQPVVTPSSMAFGTQLANAGGTSCATSQVATLSAGNSTPFTVTQTFTFSDPNFVFGSGSGTQCAVGGTVPPSCIAGIKFCPLSAGAKSGTLTFFTSAGNVALPLSGTGTSAIVTLAPTNFAFGNVTVGTASNPQSATLTNSGTRPLTITSISIIGTNPTEFSQTNNCGVTPPFTIAAGASCSFTIQFKPLTTGAKSAAISIADNAPGSPQSMTLSGTGIGSASPTLSPTSANFGNQAVNTTSAATAFTLTNPGSTPLTLNSISASGDFSASPLQGACTIYASSTGNDANSGLTFALPKTFTGAATAAQPGAVICVEGGTYNLSGSFTPPRNGTATAYITYQAYGDSPASFVYTGPNVSGNFMFNMDSSAGGFGGFAYLRFIGLSLDGGQNSHNGFFVRYGHHIEFRYNYVKNTTGSGIACNNSDYCLADHNLIYHNGEGSLSAAAATSGIAFNILCFYDNYTGFHDVVSNNIVSADEDTLANTDGNGIIMDTNCSGMTTPQNDNPPELVINNVVYMNSGECLANFAVANIYTVNNSCYKSSLNTDAGFIASHGAELGDNASELDYYVNNIGVAWQPSNPPAFSSTNGTTQAQYFKNMYQGGLNFTPNAPSQFFNQNPLYLNPPVVASQSADFQWRTAPDPATIGSAFHLQATSPAIGKGIDPSTIAGLPAQIVTDLKKYIYTDINGTARPIGGPFDLGAYQANPAPPSGPLGTCSSPLAPSASCTINVTFTPSAAGARSGTLSVSSSAAGSPTTAALTGNGTQGAITLTPSSLTFAAQNTGTTSAGQVITVTNPGTATVTLTSFTLTGTDPGDYGKSTTCGGTLAASATCTVTITFTPTATGSRPASLTLVDSAPGSPHVATLAGTGIAPAVSLTPSSLAFGNQVTGMSSVAQALTLTNNGTGPLSINSIGFTGTDPTQFTQTNTCTNTTPAISDTFSTGTLDTTKWAIDTGLIGSQSLGTVSSGLAGNVSLAQGMLELLLQQPSAGVSNGAEVRSLSTFGYGTYSVTMRAASTSATPAGGGGEVTGGVSSPFEFINNSQTEIDWPEFEGQGSPGLTGCPSVGTVCAEWTNYNGVSHSFNVNTLVPTAATAFHTYKMVWMPAEIDYYVDGTQVATSTTNIPSTPAPILMNSWGTNSASFGGVASVGTTRHFYVSSVSFTPLSSLPAGGSCSISVRFAPTATGAKSASLSVNDNAAGSPQSSTLTGTGIAGAPIVSLTPSSLTFPPQLVGVTSPGQNVTLQNVGTAALTISSIAASGDYSITNPCVSPLAINASCVITVRFTPTAAGTRTGTLTVTDSASGSPHTVSLTGTGQQALAVPAPSSIAFGNATVGFPTAPTTVTLSNPGSATLTGIVISLAGSDPGDYVLTNTGANMCQATLNAGGSCQVTVAFSPTTTGSRPATLQFVDSAASSPQSVTLSGTGIAAAPAVTLTPSSLNLGSQQVGATSSPMNTILKNTGTATLTIASVTPTGDYADVTSPVTNCGGSLAIGATCTISVTFTPTTTGTRTGAITVTTNAASSPDTVALTGQGTPIPVPVATLTPSSLTYGSQQTGTTSPSQDATLQNTGSANLTISSITLTGANPGDYLISANGCVSPILPTNTCVVSIKFAPTLAGTRTASLSVADNAAGSPHTVALSGTAFVGTPGISFNPTSLTFPAQALQVPSAVETITVGNPGLANLIISNIAITGDYSQTNGCSTVAPSGTCTISVTFTPLAPGTRTGTVTVTDNAPGSPHTVPLSGTGSGAVASFSPASQTFPNTIQGQPSPAQVESLTNSGNVSMAVNSISFSGTNPTDFSQTNNCIPTLGVNATCHINIVFMPGGTGARSATMVITDSSLTSPHSIPLSGTGLVAAPVVQLAPPSLNFGSIQQGSPTASQSITVTNVGTATLNISAVTKTGTNTADYALTDGCSGSPVAVNATCTLSVIFTPGGVGTRTASLSIADDAANTPQTVPMTGVGTAAPAPKVQLSVTNLTFPSQQVGTTSAGRTVMVTNSGDATLTFTSILLGPPNGGDYFLTNPCGGSLAPAASCTLTVTFTPLAAGTRNSTITLTDNASDSPQSVSVTGTAFTGSPVATLSTTSLAFLPQVTLTTSNPQTVGLTNTGTANLVITSIVATSDFAPGTNEFAQTNNCGGTLIPQATCIVNVTFTPQAAGSRTGRITFTNNAAGSPQVVTLSGTGMNPPPPPGPTSAVGFGGHFGIGGHAGVGIH